MYTKDSVRSSNRWLATLNYIDNEQILNNFKVRSPDVLTVTHVLVSGNVTIRLQSVQELVRIAVVR
jgi:hypothetical protein